MILVSILLFGCFLLVDCSFHQGEEHTEAYSNEWVVRIEGGPQVAQLLALQMGYELLGSVMGFPDTYRMLKLDHPVHKRGYPHLTQRLTRDVRVLWAEQQFIKQRQKRGFIPNPEHNTTLPLLTRVKRNNDLDYDFFKFSSERRFNDELWDQQWYLQDTRTRDDLPKLDLHVLPCYDMGITGKGVRVSILDDGIEYTHKDLEENYDPDISYDANDEDLDPAPRYDENHSNAHGTRCAGEVAMKANNVLCGVGVAYEARIGGVRLLDGKVDDRVEGIALGYAFDKVDIYSASWGPNDDGKTVEGPGRLAREAIERGITQGRKGKGVIFVWAGGNGGSKNDNCNCDGYTASIYTLSIGSASQQGYFPWYGEKCPATFATTYSSGAYFDQMIATTDLQNSCTIKHTGTSASAPLAAGIIALVLQVNPELTWRDVQHLVAWTSEYAPLIDNVGWKQNAAGYWVNTRFGFGLMNALSLVTAASNWTSVPEKFTCTIQGELMHRDLQHGRPSFVKFNSQACTNIKYLEHVELEVNIDYPVRGDLQIHLTSPAGTEVQLLSPREHDKSPKGFKNWKLMSVLTWNENPSGIWYAAILDKSSEPKEKGSLGDFKIYIHGTKDMPQYLKNGVRKYDYDYNRVHRNNHGVKPTTLQKLKLSHDEDLDWDDLVGLQLALRSLTQA